MKKRTSNNKISRESNSAFKTLGKAEQGATSSYNNTQGVRQEDCYKFKASLSYITSIRPARATQQDPVSNKQSHRGKDFLQGNKKINFSIIN